MTEPSLIEVSTDDELSKQLYQLLVVEGMPEVEIYHPVEGKIIVTRETYDDIVKALENVRNMSPAERLQEKNKYNRKKAAAMSKALSAAGFRVVDITDEEGFGSDVEGNEIDMDGMYFMPISQYPKDIEYTSDEVGAFIEQNEQHTAKAPIRILHQGNLSDAMQQLADISTEEERQALLDQLEKPEKMN